MNLKTIAKLAGVSTVTVSNVINGKYHKASKETVERIQKIVEETHYQPSATARSLIMKRSRIIGVVIPNLHPDDGFSVSPYNAQILAYLDRFIRNKGYYMMLHCVLRSADVLPSLTTWNVDGVFLLGVAPEDAAALSQRLCMVTVEESDTSGNLSPKAAYLLGTGNGRIDYYSNGVCYSNVYATKESIQRTGWDQPFYPPENAFISFSESDSRSEAQEVCFTAFWADSQGKVYQQTCIYTFDSTGNLSGADLTTRTQGDGNTVLQSRRALTVAKASYEDTQNVQEQPVDSYTAEAESAWGIFFRVDDDLLTDETGDVWMRAPDKPGVSNYTTDSNYWLERKTDDSWEVLESQAGDPSWGEETYRLGIRSTIIDQVDWTPYYGRLEPGLYRMGKRFSNGQETTIQYAEFQIRQRGQVTGEGGEETLARLKAEIDRICAGNYCIEQQSRLGQGNKSRKIYWKYDGVCVTDHYNGEGGAYSHSSVTYADDVNAYLFYDEWWQPMEWDDLYNNVFFTASDAITDSRVTFQVGIVGSSFLRNVEVQFDESGKLTQAEIIYIDQGEPGVPTILTVTDASEEEIRSHVEQIVAENAET